MAITQLPDPGWVQDSQVRGNLEGKAVKVDGGQVKCPSCEAYNSRLLRGVTLRKNGEVMFKKPCRECRASITYVAIHELLPDETARVTITARSFSAAPSKKSKKKRG